MSLDTQMYAISHGSRLLNSQNIDNNSLCWIFKMYKLARHQILVRVVIAFLSLTFPGHSMFHTFIILANPFFPRMKDTFVLNAV